MLYHICKLIGVQLSFQHDSIHSFCSVQKRPSTISTPKAHPRLHLSQSPKRNASGICREKVVETKHSILDESEHSESVIDSQYSLSRHRPRQGNTPKLPEYNKLTPPLYLWGSLKNTRNLSTWLWEGGADKLPVPPSTVRMRPSSASPSR